MSQAIVVLDYHGRLYGVNKRYCNRNYTLTKEYRDQNEDLAEQAWALFKASRGKTYKGDVCVLMKIETSKDIDGVIKPILDALQEAVIYTNDSQVISLAIRKVKIGPKEVEHVKVWVWEENK